jgi:asparagine synthase (glutamine-hydrolysing)
VCGIAAIIAPGASPDSVALRRMSSVIRHRGPDDDGLFVSGPIGFAFRRLAILDLSTAGHQPLMSADGQLVLVFNGEIFNYKELRAELQSLGHTFRSSGDSEVLLAAYAQWGRECPSRLNGMWAFLIYDARARCVFGSRDRFGVKPLYRCRIGDRILFASEIKAIRASGYYDAEPNWRRAAEFLLYSYHGQADDIDTTSETFYKGIEPVPAGTAFEVDLTGQIKEWRYWSLEAASASPPDDPVGAFIDTFEDAVRLRMRSDVPVGASLSGGLDSSSILCTMATMSAQRQSGSTGLHAFSYLCREFDESRYIDDTLRQTGAVGHLAKIDHADPWKALGQLLWYQDEPFNSMNILITFEIARLAKANGVKVLLNGGGADETIGGYPANFINYWTTLICAGERTKARAEIEAYCSVHGGDPIALYRGTLVHRFRSALRRLPAYDKLSEWRRRRTLQNSRWFSREIAGNLPRIPSYAEGGTLEATLKDQIERAPLPYYLRVDDRSYMAHSVEVRTPFLDYRLVDLAFSLPPDWRMRGPWNKYVLREAMRKRLPESVRARPDKMGFPVPTRDWVRGSLYEPLQDLLASRETRTRGLYDVGAIRCDLERHRAGELDVSAGLLAFAQFELWLKGLESPAAPVRLTA